MSKSLRPSGEVSAALVAAIAAIAGTIVGGAATYFGNERLQQRQIDREEARQTDAAQAIARLLRTELEDDGGQLGIMLSEEKYDQTSYRERKFVSRVGLEDRKLLSGHVSEAAWLKLSKASREVEQVEGYLQLHHGLGRLGEEELEFFKEAREACYEADDALEPLAKGHSVT